MSVSYVFGLIVMGSLVLLVLIFGILLLNGKGAFLIMSKEDKNKYIKVSLYRFTGWLLIAIFFCLMIIFVGVYFSITWLIYCGIASIPVITTCAAFFIKKDNRFLKKYNSEVSPITSRTTQLIAVFLILGITAIPIGTFWTYADKEPVVNILDSSMQIKALYGLNIDFSEITDITLMENSMSDIGTGRRTNGYDGMGETLKGNFKSSSLGDILLFVNSKSSPTIRIERTGNKDVYISFRDGDKTEMLYHEMIATVPIK